jgi:hypothetical protein
VAFGPQRLVIHGVVFAASLYSILDAEHGFTKVFQALRQQRVTSTTIDGVPCLVLPAGIHWPRHSSHLYVRAHYEPFTRAVLNGMRPPAHESNSQWQFIISGHPGIGKSAYAWYLCWYVLTADPARPIIYQSLQETQESVYVSVPGNVYQCLERDLKLCARRWGLADAIYIADTWCPRRQPYPFVLISSPGQLSRQPADMSALHGCKFGSLACEALALGVKWKYHKLREARTAAIEGVVKRATRHIPSEVSADEHLLDCGELKVHMFDNSDDLKTYASEPQENALLLPTSESFCAIDGIMCTNSNDSPPYHLLQSTGNEKHDLNARAVMDAVRSLGWDADDGWGKSAAKRPDASSATSRGRRQLKLWWLLPEDEYASWRNSLTMALPEEVSDTSAAAV